MADEIPAIANWPESARVAALEAVDKRKPALPVIECWYLVTDILDAAAPLIAAAERERLGAEIPELIIKVDGELAADQVEKFRTAIAVEKFRTAIAIADIIGGRQREVDSRIGAAIAAAEQDRLRPVLTDALEGMLEMIAYVPGYFREKWEHQGYIDRLTAALMSLDQP